MVGLAYDKVTAALKANGFEAAIPVIDTLRKSRRNRPARRSGRRLTLDDAVNIHKLYYGTDMNMAAIARRLGINPASVSYVLDGKQFPEARQHYGV